MFRINTAILGRYIICPNKIKEVIVDTFLKEDILDPSPLKRFLLSLPHLYHSAREAQVVQVTQITTVPRPLEVENALSLTSQTL